MKTTTVYNYSGTNFLVGSLNIPTGGPYLVENGYLTTARVAVIDQTGTVTTPDFVDPLGAFQMGFTAGLMLAGAIMAVSILRWSRRETSI